MVFDESLSPATEVREIKLSLTLRLSQQADSPIVLVAQLPFDFRDFAVSKRRLAGRYRYTNDPCPLHEPQLPSLSCLTISFSSILVVSLLGS